MTICHISLGLTATALQMWRKSTIVLGSFASREEIFCFRALLRTQTFDDHLKLRVVRSNLFFPLLSIMYLLKARHLL